MIKAVVIAGGSGSRLWPLSRAIRPKQFLAIHQEKTMLQATFERLEGLDLQSSVIVCNEDHRFFVAEQLREIDKLGSIILEPLAKDTAPAIALAAFQSEDEDPLLLVLPADHIIQDNRAFVKAVSEALPLAESGKLVTFGVVPKEPHTGYGYIKCGAMDGAGFLVDQFVEKPSHDVAQDYLASGKYYWNSGMFLFKASRYLQELKKFRPGIYQACENSISGAKVDLDFLRVDKDMFESCASESVDYAVMENTAEALMIPLDAGWTDIGSWSSVWDLSEKDINGNVARGDVISYGTHNSYIETHGQLVASVGVDDLVIIATKDAIMVADKNSIQHAKTIVQQLKDDGRSEWQLSREVFRPWGKYEAIDSGESYQVKRITVNPGEKLSVQMHHHRAEHWIVVSGSARVTNGGETFLLSENQSTFIPIGVVHSLENPGKINLELIEVQSGSYLGEDDIVRFEDKYGRAENQ